MNADFARQWLDILCRSLPKARSAVFVIRDGQSPNDTLLAKWPDDLSKVDDFDQVIKYAFLKNEQVCILNVQQADGIGHYDYFALPITGQSESSGIIVCKLEHSPAEHHEAIFKTMRQGGLWLALSDSGQKKNEAFYASVIRLQATCIEQPSYREALIALVAELTQLHHCERVALGEWDKLNSKVVALSNSAQFDDRANFVQKIADAMDEAIEQDSTIIVPNPQTIAIQRAHQELARKFGSGSMVTIPMINGDDAFGALTLFRSEENPFDLETVLLCQQTMSLLTPYLALKKK